MISSFTLCAARQCAAACQAAYVQTPTVQSDVAHCLVSHAPDGTQTFAFRGTSSMAEWLVDAHTRLIPYGHPGFDDRGTVHHGFISSLSTIHDQLDRLVDSTAPLIYVTGHSKGGAEAVLFALRLVTVHAIPITRIRLYTFGQPRVGDAAFAAYCDRFLGTRHFRVINREDLVPRLPVLSMGYRHGGTRILIDAFAKLLINPPWWRMLASDVMDIAWEYGVRHNPAAFAEPAADHYIAKYVGALNAAQWNGANTATLIPTHPD